MRIPAVIVALVLAGCGGPRGGGLGPPSPTGPADPAMMRALLEQYSPRGHAIVTAYEALPETFELAEGPYTVTSEDTFEGYLRDGAIEHVVTYLSTAVHELAHGYIGTMSFQLLADRGLAWGDGAEAILVDGEPWLVPFTPTFPARELGDTFPADAHTFLYDGYVMTPDEPDLATQKLGVYGMLDELCAFYQGFRTTLDLWPWVRVQANARVTMEYAVQLDAAYYPYASFKLFILHWLRYAREHHAEIYDGVIANDAFRGAFAELDDAYAALLAEIAALEPEVWALGGAQGVGLDRQRGSFHIDGHEQRPELAAPYAATLSHLDDEAYQEILAELR